MNFNNSSSRNFNLGIRASESSGGGPAGNINNTILTSSPSGFHHHHGVKYVYELPYLERKEICRIFDENNLWETLGGGLMGYSSSELSEFGRFFLRGGSPTDALLTAWGSQNHTVLELFTLFRRLSHFRAMKVIARFVDPKYHVYIHDPEINATQELIQLESPVSPVAVVAPGIPPVELKVQNNMGFHHHLPDSPKNKLADPVHKNEPEAAGKPASATASSLLDSVGHLPQIPYAELLSATNNWERRNILGKGGFGTVYRGVWKNTSVAIKRMEQRANHAYVESQMKQSLGELRCLNSCRHDNILPLYGFSLEGEHPCLVYQFMVNGSLEDRLLCRHKSSPLQWQARYQITRGVVCGIQFLHSIGTKPLIHGDIKSANILLDKNFEAKIGDFGLAREMPTTNDKSYVKVSRVHGTRPYLPDEYLRSKKLSTKVDTYSFGIMLFEIATGQRAYEESRSKKFLREVVEDAEGNYEPLRDAKGGNENPDIFWHFIRVGRSCTERIAKNRPEMVQVLKAFDLFASQQNTQASSIRTVSSQVTGIPLLFETPNSRPASLLIPGGSSTTPRLSPEMRANSPNWMPLSQAQGGYQTPPTISTSHSTASNNRGTQGASNHIPTQHQHSYQPILPGGEVMVRRSPVPVPSSIPQMAGNINGLSNIAPGFYNHNQQMVNPFQQQQHQYYGNLNNGVESTIPFNIGGGPFMQPYSVQQSPALVLQPATPRSRNPSHNSNNVRELQENIPNSFPNATPTVANQVEAIVSQPHNIKQQDLQKDDKTNRPSIPLTTPSSASTQNKEKEDGDDFLPVFLLDKRDDSKGGKSEIADNSEDEDHNEWTMDEQDGPATVIPLITELGIKDPQETCETDNNTDN